MSNAPQGVVFSNVLQRLLEPNKSVARKRVTLLYRPVDSSMTATIAEQDVNTANARLTSTRNGSARLAADLAAAKSTAADLFRSGRCRNG